MICHQLPLANTIPSEGLGEAETAGAMFSGGIGGRDVFRSRGIIIIDGKPMCQDIENVFGSITSLIEGICGKFFTTILEFLSFGCRSIASLR